MSHPSPAIHGATPRTSWPKGVLARHRAPVLIAALVAVGIVVAIVARPGSEPGLAETIITSTDDAAVDEAIATLVADPDLGALQRIVRASETRSVVADRLSTITEELTERFATAGPTRAVGILEGLAVIDDFSAAPAFVDALLSDDAEVGQAAARLIPGLSESLAATIALIVERRGDLADAAAAAVDELLVSLGEPALDAVAAVAPERTWALDLLVGLGEPAIGPLREMSAAGGLADQPPVVVALLKLDKSHPEASDQLWPDVMDRLGDFVSGNLSKASLLGDILRKIERTHPDLARPIQRDLLALLLPKLASEDFAVPETIAHVGTVVVPKLIEIARTDGPFVSQDVMHRADFARLALISMTRVAPRALAPLMDALEAKDYELIGDLMLFYIQLGKPGSEPVLIEAMNRYGDTIMALQFLQSGNRKLEQGARDWAARNGYTITGSYSGPGSWGMG